MDELLKLARNRPNIGRIFKRVFEKKSVQDLFVSLLRMQMNRSETGTGEQITNQETGDQYYKRLTAEIYMELYGRRIMVGSGYQLRASGDFQSSIRVADVNEREATISADTDKGEDDLILKFGREILELNEESKQKLIPGLIKEFQEELKNEILRNN